MTSKKRGLSRGLEALLADVPVKSISTNIEERHAAEESQKLRITLQQHREQASPSAADAMSNANIAISLHIALHREKLNLLKEAEALKQLLDDFESVIS